MFRKLATIQTIKEILPISNADSIELISFNDMEWKCVSKKGEFNVGDRCVYFEIDSLLPLTSTFEFLSKQGVKKTVLESGKAVEGYRLRTIKLRGQLSQGLALPLTIVPEGVSVSEGVDLTEILNVHKYEQTYKEPEAETQSKNFFTNYLLKYKIFRRILSPSKLNCSFPSFISKTDEERVQTQKPIIEKYKDKEWYSSIKYDGSSITIAKLNGEFIVASRNMVKNRIKVESRFNNILKKMRSFFIRNSVDISNHFFQTSLKYDLDKTLPEGFAIQGELYGEGIQKNPHKIKGKEIRVFNVYNIKEGCFLNLKEAMEFTEKLGLKFVEIKIIGTLEGHTFDSLMKMADETKLEGLVFRTVENIFDEKFRRVSFKVISNNYLLKE